MNLGEKIKKLRKENNLSQEQLAEKLSISRQSISKWESGKTYPDIENLILLRGIFNITVDELLSDKDNKTIEEDIETNIKKDDDYYEEDEYEEEDDESLSDILIFSGFIIGIGIGFITNNFMWGIAASFVGLGIGEILEYIKNHKK